MRRRRGAHLTLTLPSRDIVRSFFYFTPVLHGEDLNKQTHHVKHRLMLGVMLSNNRAA